MSWIAVAVIGGAVIGAGASYLAADKAAGATEEAANAAASSQNYATDIANQNYQQQREDFMPFYNVGKEAIPTYEKMLYGGYDMEESPAAQYELMKGTRALNRALASRGLSGLGNAVNRLTELNQSVAASDWNNQYNRILDALKLGTGAASSMGSASNTNTQANQNAATNLANIYQNQGNNQASLYAGIPGMAASYATTGLQAYQAFKNQPSTTSNSTPSFYQAEDYEY